MREIIETFSFFFFFFHYFSCFTFQFHVSFHDVYKYIFWLTHRKKEGIWKEQHGLMSIRGLCLVYFRGMNRVRLFRKMIRKDELFMTFLWRIIFQDRCPFLFLSRWFFCSAFCRFNLWLTCSTAPSSLSIFAWYNIRTSQFFVFLPLTIT